MNHELPLLANRDSAFFPSDKRCPVCGVLFENVSTRAWVCAGAMLLTDDRLNSIETDRLVAQFYVRLSDGSRSSASTIIDNLVGGEFDLCFCSATCLRKWFDAVVSDLERKQEEISGQDEDQVE